MELVLAGADCAPAAAPLDLPEGSRDRDSYLMQKAAKLMAKRTAKLISIDGGNRLIIVLSRESVKGLFGMTPSSTSITQA
jgi:hypothetical protein